MKERIDHIIVRQGLARSRSQAQTLIKTGTVSVDGKTVSKPSEMFDDNVSISISSPLQFVSRAGTKLSHALEEFDINVKDMIALDIGSSTGGFTDCLLQKNAKEVHAVDVGTDQFDPALKNNPRVHLFEKTDIRDFQTSVLFDVAVCDVSFISATYIIPVIPKLLKKHGLFVLLVKPQFEVGPQGLNKRGIVKDASLYSNIIEQIKASLTHTGLEFLNITDSPILGGDGNKEFIILSRRI